MTQFLWPGGERGIVDGGTINRRLTADSVLTDLSAVPWDWRLPERLSVVQ